VHAEKKYAASPGGTFFILLPAPMLSTRAPPARAVVPKPSIPEQKLLVAALEGS
jgi:hypothetical protein